ncbi:hypothetical protein F4861DRAFT_542209 [Xylaria intraflava]|nr:hypothetical protein F4861DRAFT_542209 [Xylaria intraflava]
MDALKNLASGKKSEGSTKPEANAPATGQKDDYGDKGRHPEKGAEFLNKKYLGDKLSRDQLEKITDSGREALEKATGKKVPEKFSN